MKLVSSCELYTISVSGLENFHGFFCNVNLSVMLQWDFEWSMYLCRLCFFTSNSWFEPDGWRSCWLL